jgi:hypothetical protein
MTININIYIIILLIILFYIHFSDSHSYIPYYPSLRILYPSNEAEIQDVIHIMKQRTYTDEQFFYLTDPSVSNAFRDLLPEVQEKELNDVCTSQNHVIITLKYLMNRARPYQVETSINNKKLVSHTADTPAYPSGHSFQAFYLAKYYSKLYPNKKRSLYNMAERCGIARIHAGHHYPSDHSLSRWLVDKMFS